MKTEIQKAIIGMIGREPNPYRDSATSEWERAWADLNKWHAEKEWTYKSLTAFAHSIGAKGDVFSGYCCLDSTHNPELCPARVMSVWYRNDSPSHLPPIYNQVRIECTDQEIASCFLSFISSMDTNPVTATERIKKWEKQKEETKEKEIKSLKARLAQLEGRAPMPEEGPIWKPKGMPSVRESVSIFVDVLNEI